MPGVWNNWKGVSVFRKCREFIEVKRSPRRFHRVATRTYETASATFPLKSVVTYTGCRFESWNARLSIETRIDICEKFAEKRVARNRSFREPRCVISLRASRAASLDSRDVLTIRITACNSCSSSRILISKLTGQTSKYWGSGKGRIYTACPRLLGLSY